MGGTVARPNCYKHGLEYEDVVSAWENVLAHGYDSVERVPVDCYRRCDGPTSCGYHT